MPLSQRATASSIWASSWTIVIAARDVCFLRASRRQCMASAAAARRHGTPVPTALLHDVTHCDLPGHN